MTQSQLKAPADVAKAPEHAMITESGLASNLISPGTGHEKPSATSTVTVHYTGWKSSDGSMFDSSVIRGQPASFPLNRVIAGWTEGLQLMTVGEKRRFWIPQDLAYGPEVPGSGRPGGQLVFDVELISFEKGPEPLRIPGDAAQTESGIAYVITETGTGDAPANDHMVEFHFTFFDPDGQVVQSSRQAGPQTALMGNLPPFFTELFVRLSPGGKADAYIPGKLLGAAFEFVKCELDLLSIKQTPPHPRFQRMWPRFRLMQIKHHPVWLTGGSNPGEPAKHPPPPARSSFTTAAGKRMVGCLTAPWSGANPPASRWDR